MFNNFVLVFPSSVRDSPEKTYFREKQFEVQISALQGIIETQMKKREKELYVPESC